MAEPIKRFHAGRCTASIFGNEITTPNDKFVVKSVTLQRAYRTKEGQYQYKHSLRADDLPTAILLLMKAYEYLVCNETRHKSV